MRELKYNLNKHKMNLTKGQIMMIQNMVNTELSNENTVYNPIELESLKKQLLLCGVGSSLPNVYEEPHNSARIKFYKNLAETMNISEYATRHIFNEACDWYKTLT